jgi:regulator of protease activity HflC (stomatin/prohibitin superfamily)
MFCLRVAHTEGAAVDILLGLCGTGFFIVIFVVLFLVLPCVKIIKQYERGVILRWGRYQKTVDAGLTLVFPYFAYQQLIRVDIRQVAFEIAPQEVMTKDNINIKVGAVVYYRVTDAAKAVLGVQNYNANAISKTQAVLRDIVGTSDMNSILQSREEIADRVRELVEKDVETWGLQIDQILMQQIELPNDMVRAMAQKAVAERNREATIIASSAELEASKNVTKAAIIMSAVPGAIRLRELQTIKDISSEQNEKIIIFMPAKSQEDGLAFDPERIKIMLDAVDKGDISAIAAAAAGQVAGTPPTAPPTVPPTPPAL